MSRLLVVMIVVLTWHVRATAQCPERDYDVQAFSYGAIGVTRPALDSLNSFLTLRQSGSFGSQALALSVGSFLFVQRLYVGNDLRLSLWENAESGSAQSSLLSGSLLLSIGTNLMAPQGPVSLYPYFCAGGALTRLHIRGGSQSFNGEGAFGEHGEVIAWSPRIVVGGGAGVGYTMGSGEMIYTIGIRAGYHFDASQTTRWFSGTGRLSGGPDLFLGGPYIQAVFGIGRNSRYVNDDLWGSDE